MHFYQRAASNTIHTISLIKHSRLRTNHELNFCCKHQTLNAKYNKFQTPFNKTNLTSLTLAFWLRTTQNWSFLCYNSFLIITGNKKMTGSPPKSRACALILPLCLPRMVHWRKMSDWSTRDHVIELLHSRWPPKLLEVFLSFGKCWLLAREETQK